MSVDVSVSLVDDSLPSVEIIDIGDGSRFVSMRLEDVRVTLPGVDRVSARYARGFAEALLRAAAELDPVVEQPADSGLWARDSGYSDPPWATPAMLETCDGPIDPTPCSTCGRGIRLGGTTEGEARYCQPCWRVRSAAEVEANQ